LPLLTHSPFFLGSEENPLRQPLRISEEKATPAIEIESAEDGLVLRTILTLEGKTVQMQSDKTQVISQEPLWLVSGSVVFPFQDMDGWFKAFMEQSEIEIPEEEEALFLEQYLLPLAERVPIRGEGIEWREESAEAIPRVYLAEDSGELKAHLRFG